VQASAACEKLEFRLLPSTVQFSFIRDAERVGSHLTTFVERYWSLAANEKLQQSPKGYTPTFYPGVSPKQSANSYSGF
jgi:hypothetical protein